MKSEQERQFYSHEYFAQQADGSARSAAVVVPLVLSLLQVTSVIDIGCGVGTWVAAFLANGVTDAQGVDGDHVDRAQLRIPSDQFLARDLTEPLCFNRVYNLAVCLEVAEHLPESRAAGLIADLTSLAPCVLFSAAVPGPSGTNHINPQYLPYWAELFQRQGFDAIDPIRPRVWNNPQVEWFYQQDIVMFATSGHSLLSKGYPRPPTIIHQQLYEQVLQRPLTLGMIAKGFLGATRRSLRYHWEHR
jgi:SAM-dependent methyltransferase